MRITTLAAGSLLVLALTSCSGDDSGGDAGSGGSGTDAEEVDVCSLVSTEDLEEMFDSPFAEGEATHQEQTGGDQCTWGNTDAPPVKVFSITLLREGHLSEAFEKAGVTVFSLFQDAKEYAPDAESVDIGDEAYLSGSVLEVLDGDSYYTFTTTTGDSEQALEGMKALAEQVVG